MLKSLSISRLGSGASSLSRNSSSALSKTFSNAAEGFYSLQQAPSLHWGTAVQLLKQQQQQQHSAATGASGSAAAAAGSAAFGGDGDGGSSSGQLPAELALLLLAVKHLACIAQVRDDGTVVVCAVS
jgi:hypothetical protein